MTFEVHCPKEKKNRWRIIKTFTVKAYAHPSLCPVNTFITYCLLRSAQSVDTLFINIQVFKVFIPRKTISKWVHRLISLSASEKRNHSALNCFLFGLTSTNLKRRYNYYEQLIFFPYF
ncbi:uncharacterized protein B0P05DRAFT_528298 [Gilbertella persicaria]|uniref:uncharacterized protein n=1 Tax=Gilbertella persicaria TaxID=101096 RepID=UPI00222114AD|nr:uncharacterized protein B0P05DRAFT_528298 [Gilbertella persicaria]KAI8090991.1 hypothetical protein B0P05DRAFT_528298 [Gilbertella persicaria]